MVIVWPEVEPVPEKVPVAVAPVALVVRVNVLELLPAELVRVMVGAVVDVGAAATVPTTEDAVELVVRFNTFEPWVIVTP
jgi:molybdopterin biosynthesis enzyme